MKFAIYTKGERYFPKEDLINLQKLSYECGFDMVFNRDFVKYSEVNYGVNLNSYTTSADIDADFVLSFGGDGTFLHCVTMLEARDIPILGVNSGRLGFLSSVGKDDFVNAIRSILRDDYIIEKRSMIEVDGDFEEQGIYPHLFNEFTIQKSELNMVDIALEINSQKVATVAADGMIVSTPSGSTAYSLSTGGAILSPACKTFIITPIAPHNLTMRPIVVDESATITMRVTSRIGECYATLDNRAYKIKSGAKFNLKLSPYNVSIVKLGDSSFFETLRKKLMWGSPAKY